MKNLYWRVRRWLFPPKPPRFTFRIGVGVPRIFEWSIGMAVDTTVGRGCVTACNYNRGTIDVGVWA